MLISNRHSTSPRVRRDVARNSNADVSDDEIGAEAEFEPTPSRNKTKPTHQVTETKHKAAASFRTKATSAMAGVGDFLQKKVAFDERKFESDAQRHIALQLLSREKLDMECRREERLAREAKQKEEASDKQTRLAMATKILELPGASAELKLAAQQVLLSLLIP